MGMIKDRYGMNLTEAEDIRKEVAGIHRKLYKKRIFTTQINMMV